MEDWATKLDAEIHSFALGEAEGMLEINLRAEEIGGSSLFEDVGSVDLQGRYAVPVKRFDAVFSHIPRPALCKIDVQGAELMVISGMKDKLAEIDVLIVECSLIATLEGEAPEFFDVMQALHGHGFVFYEWIGVARRPLDGALAQLDAVFVPRESVLRADRRWAAD